MLRRGKVIARQIALSLAYLGVPPHQQHPAPGHQVRAQSLLKPDLLPAAWQAATLAQCGCWTHVLLYSGLALLTLGKCSNI